MGDYLGISLGRESLALCVVSRTKASLSVKHFRRVDYPESDLSLSERAVFAAKTAAESEYARIPVAVALPGEDVFLQPLTAVFTKRAHVSRTLKFEMEDKLPFDVDEAVLDFAVTGREGGGSGILVAAIPYSVLGEAIGPFQGAGLKLRLVTSEVLSAGSLGAFVGEEAYTLLDVGPFGWRLALCRSGRLLFARAAPAAPAAERMEEALGGWFKQSFMAAPAEIRSTRVLLSGASAGGLDCEALTASFGVPVERLELVQSSFVDAAEDVATAPGALSAAAALALGKPEIDLSRGARGEERIFENLARPVSVALALLALVFGILCWGYRRQAGAALAEVESARGEEVAIWQELFPDEETPADINRALASALDGIRQSGGADALGPDADWLLRALHVVSVNAPEGVELVFRELSAGAEGLTISVSSSDPTAADEMEEAVNAEGTFTAEASGRRTDEEGQATFDIVMKPKEGRDAG